MTDTTREQLRSVFEEEREGLFAIYEAELSFRDKIMAGVPTDPKIMEAWIRSQAGVEKQEEIRQMTLRTLTEMGADVDAGMTFEELEKASEEIAANKSTNAFKRDEGGLYVEDRQVKAMIKESVNILFADQRWGKTRKGPKNFTAERVFVEPPRIHLSTDEPDGVELVIGHITDKAGKRSTLAFHEYVENAVLEMRVEVLRDEVEDRNWSDIWLHAERNGLGALRSQSFGRFYVTRWERTA